MHAVSNGFTDLACYLVELGAEINLQDNNGWSPLMYAVSAEDLDTVQLLVAYGASVHLKTNDKKSIFQICCQELINTPLFQELVSVQSLS